MNDAFLMGVLNGMTNVDEETQPLNRRQIVLIAVVRDGNAAHQFHHEVGPAGVGGAGVEDFGDVGVVHHRQGLPLGLEAGHDGSGVHPELNDFQGHTPFYRRLLLGNVDDAETSFADFLQQAKSADDRLGAF